MSWTATGIAAKSTGCKLPQMWGFPEIIRAATTQVVPAVIDANEVVTLVFTLVCGGILFALNRKEPLPRLPWFYAALFALLGNYVFTIVEGIYGADFFNFLQHLCLALAGIFFALGFRKQAVERASRPPQAGP